MAQFFHSCQQYSVCDKSLKLYKEDFIKDLTPLVKYIKACPDIINKDINMLVALLPTLKIFLFFLNLKVIEVEQPGAVHLKKVLSKILKN